MCDDDNSNNNRQPELTPESESDSQEVPFNPEIYLRPLTEGAETPNQKDYKFSDNSSKGSLSKKIWNKARKLLVNSFQFSVISVQLSVGSSV